MDIGRSAAVDSCSKGQLWLGLHPVVVIQQEEKR